ncbi:MAG: hypothetical protein UW14_C0001G0039 [Candidatus Yanofskybacteria bacterium GW2011_GWA2_44_10]|nr:MAG: hypothetical protein UW14_C0001G0039 [Candidatus Yanofskybacteria bacterium GW2011_GWA2_44_10]
MCSVPITYGWRRRYDAQGVNGEIPSIDILEACPVIPPIEDAYTIDIESFIKGKIYESVIWITWHVGTGLKAIRFRLRCRMTDKRFRIACTRRPDILDRILNELRPILEQKTSSQSLIICLGQQLSLDSLPNALKPFFDSVLKWADFISRCDIRSNPGSYSQVHNGYYYYYLHHSQVVVPASNMEEEREEEAFNNEFKNRFSLPHAGIVRGDVGVKWTNEEDKITLVLLHRDTSERVAKYYHYLDLLNDFRNEEKRYEQERAKNFAEAPQCQKVINDELIREARRAILLS